MNSVPLRRGSIRLRPKCQLQCTSSNGGSWTAGSELLALEYQYVSEVNKPDIERLVQEPHGRLKGSDRKQVRSPVPGNIAQGVENTGDSGQRNAYNINIEGNQKGT